MGSDQVETWLAHAASALRHEHGGNWGEHPSHPVTDWQYEAANGDTRLGYWEWAAARIENDGEEPTDES